jgi:hypothetical protein
MKFGQVSELTEFGQVSGDYGSLGKSFGIRPKGEMFRQSQNSFARNIISHCLHKFESTGDGLFRLDDSLDPSFRFVRR